VNNLTNQELAPDFNDPLGLLKACHLRMLGFCNLLEKMQKHIRVNGIDTDVKQSAQKIHRYFSTAGAFHHKDEEQDLFPLLIGSSPALTTIIHSLEQDHNKLDEHWEKLSPLLATPSSIEKDETFNQYITDFCEAYRTHIDTEEKNLLPMAQHVLNKEQLHQLGKNMKERREKSY